MTLPRAMATSLKTLALAAGALVLAALAPAAASAQSITVTINSIDGEAVNTLGEYRLGLQDCLDDVELEFELMGVPSDKSTIDVYEGNNCNDPSRDSDDTDTCDYLTSFETQESTELIVTLNASVLGCMEGTSQQPTLWFLAVDSSESGEEVGQRYGTFEIEVDASAPNAPTDVEGGTGENQIPVEWETSDSDLDSFIIYIDSSPTDGDAGIGCGSSVLVEGQPPPSGGVTTKTINEANATSANLRPSDLDGTRAAVAVVAVDDAGNESPLSNISCVEIVPTTSFWEDYQSDPNAVDGGCPCAAVGPVHVENGWPILLALCALGLRRRRARAATEDVR